jgi:DNA helicase-2/ATP-dependent DNA helicase PcrA
MLHGQLRYNIASRFLDELPDGLVRWLSPQRVGMPPAREVETGIDARRGDAMAGRPGWRIGQSVKHAKFGLGIIIDAEGRGSDARVQVNFRDAGVKWLALEYAKLQPA